MRPEPPRALGVSLGFGSSTSQPHILVVCNAAARRAALWPSSAGFYEFKVHIGTQHLFEEVAVGVIRRGLLQRQQAQGTCVLAMHKQYGPDHTLNAH